MLDKAAQRRHVLVMMPGHDGQQLFVIGVVRMGREIKWIVVRGKIPHSEHASLELMQWHFAVQNTGIISNTVGYLD